MMWPSGSGGYLYYEGAELRDAVQCVVDAPLASVEGAAAAVRLIRATAAVSTALVAAERHGAPELALYSISRIAAKLREGPQPAVPTRQLLASISRLLAAASGWSSEISFLARAHSVAGNAVLSLFLDDVPSTRDAALSVFAVSTRSSQWREPLLDLTSPASASFLSCLSIVAPSFNPSLAMDTLGALLVNAQAPPGSLSRILDCLCKCAVASPDNSLELKPRLKIARSALAALARAVADVSVLPELELALEPGEQPEYARTVCSLCTHVTQTAKQLAADPRQKAPMPPDGPLFRDADILTGAIVALVSAFKATVRLGRSDLAHKLMCTVGREADFVAAVQVRVQAPFLRYGVESREAQDLQLALRCVHEIPLCPDALARIIDTSLPHMSPTLAQIPAARTLAARIASGQGGGGALEVDSRAICALAASEPWLLLHHVPIAAHACATRLLDAGTSTSAACALMGALGELCAFDTDAALLSRDPVVVSSVLTPLLLPAAPSIWLATMHTLTRALERGGPASTWLQACAEISVGLGTSVVPALQAADDLALVPAAADLCCAMFASAAGAALFPAEFLVECVTAALRCCDGLVDQLSHTPIPESPRTPDDEEAQPFVELALHSALKLLSKLVRLGQYESAESALVTALSGHCEDGSICAALLPLIGGRVQSEQEGALPQRSSGSKRKERGGPPASAVTLGSRAVRVLGMLMDETIPIASSGTDALVEAVIADEDAQAVLELVLSSTCGKLRDAAHSIQVACGGMDSRYLYPGGGAVWDPIDEEDDSGFCSARSWGVGSPLEDDDFDRETTPPRMCNEQPWESVANLMDMGFTERDVRDALDFTHGHVGDAAMRLTGAGQ